MAELANATVSPLHGRGTIPNLMAEQLNNQLLDEFVHNFYGYGSHRAQFWFIGMEEGGGDSFSEVARRLETWGSRGKREVDDVAEYLMDIGITHLHSDRPELQKTWSGLIRILLSCGGETPTTEQVREYQKTFLGRLTGNTYLAELFPLPSPSLGHWLYAEHSTLPYLASRKVYRQTCLAFRSAHFHKRISEYKPAVVVFYGLSYRKYWQAIAGVDLRPELDGVYAGRDDATFFVVTRHPAARGVTNEYFHQVGRLIRDEQHIGIR